MHGIHGCPSPTNRPGPHTPFRLDLSFTTLSFSFSFQRVRVHESFGPFPTSPYLDGLGSTLKSYESFPSYLFHPVERGGVLGRYSAGRNSTIREGFKRARIYARLIKLRFHLGPMKN